MKILKISKDNNYLVTIAIGDQFYQEWADYILPSWLLYCDRNDFGLVVIDKDLVDAFDKKWKKATWQKLLIGSEFIKNSVEVENICFLDADILINPFSPNVFDYHDDDKISVVSQTKTPFDQASVLRKIAFLRNKHLSSDYPLDSALFMTKGDYYKHHDFKEQEDVFCAGFFIFNVSAFASIMESWFFDYPSDVDTLSNGGDEPILNFEFQNHGKVKWLDYKFQALWLYEMAEKYPFLYPDMDDVQLVKKCIKASLHQNYFLHFAGKWEGSVYKDRSILDEEFLSYLKAYNDYLKVPVSGKPLGTINPRHRQ